MTPRPPAPGDPTPVWRVRLEPIALRVAAYVPLVGPHRAPSSQTVESAAGYGAATSLSICGAALLPCAVVGFSDSTRLGLVLSACALGSGLIGFEGRRRLCFPDHIRSGLLLVSVLVTWLAMVTVSTIVYLTTGTAGLSDAVFESISGFATAAFTVLEPERLDRSVLLWRAVTQWIGGFAALLTVLVVLPFLGVGAAAAGDGSKSTRESQLVSGRGRRRMRRYLLVYVGLTATGIALYRLGGMGPSDAVTHALTTISTGGFSSHPDSFGSFDSALLEWFAIAGMGLAAINFALLWSTASGRASALWHSHELRAFVLLGVLVSAVVLVDTAGERGLDHESIRHGLFAVVSLLSTTGYTIDGWGNWGPASQVVLFVAMGVGAMSGSAGGGFRVLRVVVLFDLMRRELVHQLRPNEVRVLRSGDQIVDERVASRMLSHQVLWFAVVLFGAIAIGTSLDGPLESILLAVSSVSTVGPHVLSASTDVSGLGLVAQLVIAVLALCGRLAFYPVIAGLVAAAGLSADASRNLATRVGR